jgi:hypothetical protein
VAVSWRCGAATESDPNAGLGSAAAEGADDTTVLAAGVGGVVVGGERFGASGGAGSVAGDGAGRAVRMMPRILAQFSAASGSSSSASSISCSARSWSAVS